MSPSETAAIVYAEQLLQAGQWVAARQAAQALIERPAVEVRARAVVANAAMQSGDYGEAAAQFRQLRDALPGHAGIRSALSMALNNLGSSALQRGDATAAEAFYLDALAADSRNALAWHNLGACAQARNDFGAAARAYAHAAGLDPARVDARLHWAQCERARGFPEAARAALAPVDPAAIAPDIAARLGAEWGLLGQAEVAARAYARASASGDAALLLQIAQAQLGSGDDAAGRTSAQRAAAAAGDEGTRLRAALLAALSLPTVVATVAGIDEARQRFASGTRHLAADWPGERLRGSSAILDDLAHSHYTLAYYGMDDSGLARTFGDWYGAAAAAIDGSTEAPAPAKRSARHIAMVSARWNLGTISAYFAPWIGALRSAGWQVDVYHIGSMVDAVTRTIADSASRFLHLPGPLAAVAQHLRQSAPALILYPEIGLSPRIYPLAALRLAPIQLGAWGHPVSSGLSTLDGWLSCATMEPADGANHYREPLHLLPGLGTAYARPAAAPTLPRAELGLPASGRLYLAPHSPVKLHPAFDDLIARILAADQAATVVMIEDQAPALSARIRQRLSLAGIDTERQIHWLPWATPEHFRAVLRACDVLLDTPGFSGGNTSLDAIAQGLPLVTLPGASMRSRQSAAMLRACGCEELIADSAEAYVDRALRVANDADHARELRQRLLDPAATLFDDREALDALVDTLERLRSR